MSRKKCRRKVWGLVNPIQHAIDGASITPGHLLDRLRLVELSAIESSRNQIRGAVANRRMAVATP